MDMGNLQPGLPDKKFIPPIMGSGKEKTDPRVERFKKEKEALGKDFNYVAVETLTTHVTDIDAIEIDPQSKKLLSHKAKQVPYQTKEDIIDKYLGKSGNVGKVTLKGKVVDVKLIESAVDSNSFLVFVKYEK